VTGEKYWLHVFAFCCNTCKLLRGQIDNSCAVGKNILRSICWRILVSYGAPSIEEFQAGTVVKYEPISTGTTTKRKRKPHILAVINECCTGCAGSPACVEYCPVGNACIGRRTSIIRHSGGLSSIPCCASGANFAPAKVPMALSSKAVRGTRLIWCRWRSLRAKMGRCRFRSM